MSRTIRRLHPLVLVLLALTPMASALTPMASARSPIAHAAGKCGVGSGRGYGYSYLTYLWVYRTSCANGSYLAKKHGRVSGWRCSKKILDRSPVQYDAKVTCNSGGRQVQWTFTQNT